MMKSKAVVTQGDSFAEKEIEVPSLGPHDLLVRVHVAAFNPTDKLAYEVKAFPEGAVLGCDFAGTVEAVGDEVTQFSVGNRVGAFIWGGELPNIGAYSQYCIADSRIAFQVPDNITLEQAATIPLAATTAALALFSKDCLSLEKSGSNEKPLMILGGSSSVGSYALQIAALHGIETVCTASQKNFQTAKQEGAKATFDYNDSNTVQNVHQQFPDLDLVFDTIGSPSSTETVAKLLESRKSKLCTVRPGKAHTEKLPQNIEVSDVFVFTAFLKEHSYRGKAHWPVNHENHALAKTFFGNLPSLISSGKIKPRPVKSLGKLEPDTLLKAIELVREGKISNEKLCFSVS